jgi:predicted RNase H-like HicB family nuclease
VNPRRLLARIARGDLANVTFADMRRLVEAFGFELRADERQPPRLRTPGRSRARQPAGGARSGKAVPDPAVPPPGRTVRSEPGGRTLSDYHINVFYSEEDGAYVADIPDLEACSAFGSTPEEALAEVAKAKEAWLAAARDAGKPIPEPRYRPAIYAR